jgi:hypothetical protein
VLRMLNDKSTSRTAWKEAKRREVAGVLRSCLRQRRLVENGGVLGRVLGRLWRVAEVSQVK